MKSLSYENVLFTCKFWFIYTISQKGLSSPVLVYPELHVSSVLEWTLGHWRGLPPPQPNTKDFKEAVFNALCPCVYIYIWQLSSFRVPTLWFIYLSVATVLAIFITLFWVYSMSIFWHKYHKSEGPFISCLSLPWATSTCILHPWVEPLTWPPSTTTQYKGL